MFGFKKFFAAALMTTILAGGVSAHAASSEESRQDKTILLAAQLTGLGPSDAGSQGLVAGFYLTPDLVLFAEVMKNSYTSIYNSSVSGAEDRNGVSYGAHVKYFLGNSFYLRGGLDQRNSHYAYSDTGGSSGFDAQSLAANFSIGNQWQWSVFTLGCDWIGLERPISTTYTGDYVNGTNQFQAQSNYNDRKSAVTGNQLNLLRFYLGVSF